MSISLVRFLAWRYVTSHSSSTIRTMIAVCFISIFIGTCSLALIFSVMRGIEYETHKKLQSVYPSVMVKAPDGNTLEHEPLRIFLEKRLGHLITGITPYTIRQGLMHPIENQENTCVISIKGIEPTREANVTALATMTSPAGALENLSVDTVLLGKGLAQELGVSVGDQVTLIGNEQQDSKNLKDAQLVSIPLRVTGIINTGIAEYEDHLVVVTLDLITKIWTQDSVTHLGIKLAHDKNQTLVLDKLQSLEGLESYSWKDLYPALVSALKLEKYAMFFILLLVTLVASMNIISLLFMYITYKRTDIALLKMLGMKNWHLLLLFLLFGLLISACAAFTGLCTAYAVGIVLQTYPFITLPDAYYVTHLPVSLEPHIFFIVFVVVLLLTIIASLLPLSTIKKLNITHTLRCE